VRPPLEAALTDAQLLEGFTQRGDEAAFEVLLSRHGPMVLGLCRRLLRNGHDAEDAFQATFLVLVRKAGSLRERDLLGNWLYGVAYRIAVRVRANNSRRQAVETLDADRVAGAAGPAPAEQELRWLLQEELSRLPDKYRQPVVLCYLEGQTNEEAARRLSWPVGTVKGRLARARDLLRRRLTRRGVTLSSAALAAALSQNPIMALPPPLIVSTVKAALVVTAGKAAALGGLSAPLLGLVNGSLQAMRLARLKAVLGLVFTMAVLLPGAGVLVPSALGPRAVEPKTDSPPAKTPAPPRANAARPLSDTVDLRARFVENQPFYQEIKVETKQVTKITQMENSQLQSQTFWMRWTPLGKKDGNVVVNLKIAGVKMDMDIGGNKITYDSRVKNQPPNPLTDYGNKLKGAEFTLWLNDDNKSDKYGAVVKVEVREALQQWLVPGAIKSMLSEDTVHEWGNLLNRALPGRVVKKGETWTASGRQDRPTIGQYLTSYHFTYEGPAGALDLIRVKTVLKYTPPRDEDKDGLPFRILKANFKTCDGSGVVLFDRSHGRIAHATLDTTVAGTLLVIIGGMNTEVDLVQTQRTTINTSDTNPLP